MKKRLLSMFLVLTMVFSLIPAMGITAWAIKDWYTSGKGTEADPYIISTYDGLNDFAAYVNQGNSMSGKYIKLADNFGQGTGTMGAVVLTTPIGADSCNSFKGTFDGNGQTVRLYITNVGCAGLFGSVAEEGDVKNVITIGSVTATGTYSCAGGVVGSNDDYGSVENCCSLADVTATDNSSNVGGVVGFNNGYGSTINCFSTGRVNVQGTNTSSGGVVGTNYATVTNCYYITPPAGVTYSCQYGIALTEAQMKAAAGETNKDWVVINGKFSTMVDALNDYVMNHGDFLNWGVMDEGTYPVLSAPTVILHDGKAYTDTSYKNEITVSGLSYESGVYTFNNVRLSVCSKAVLWVRDKAATIKLVGDNQFGSLANTVTGKNGYYSQTGINAISCDLTITGNGSLTVYDYEQGILAKNLTFDKNFTGTLTINDYGREINCCLNAKGGITIENGTFYLNNTTSNGISADTIKISGGTVNVKGGKAAIAADNKLTIADTMTVTGANETYSAGETKQLKNKAGTEYVTINLPTAQKELTVVGTSVADKEYDGNTTATIDVVGSLDGVVSGDDVSIDTATGTFDDKNVGEGKTVTVSYTLKGKDADKYTVQDDEITADITKKELMVSGTTVGSKTYDGNTTATIDSNGILQGVETGDDVSIDTATGTFDDKNAGEDKDVTVNYTLSGADAGNYTVQNGEEVASINAKTITVAGTTVESKTYDGTTAATVTAGSLDGVVSGDDVSIDTATGTFDDKNVGEDKDVTVNYTLSGTDADNYTVQNGEEVASINAKTITVTPDANQSKVKDDADPTLTYTVEGAVEGETAKFTGALSREAGDAVGSSYAITLGDLTLTDDGTFLASNYELKLSETTVYFSITEKKAEICKYKAPIAAGEAQTLLLCGKEAGKYTINEVSGGYTINDGTMYIALSADGKSIVKQENSYTWKFDGGLYGEVKTTSTSRFFFWSWNTTKTTKIYLNQDADALTVSSEFVKAQIQTTGSHDWICKDNHDGTTHTVYCSHCNEVKDEAVVHNYTYDETNHKCVCGAIDPDYCKVTAINVAEKKVTSYTGFWFWKKAITRYQYTICPQTQNVCAAKVEYSGSGEEGSFTPGTVFTSDIQLSQFYIKVTDTNGKVTNWVYKDRNVSEVSQYT